MSASQSKYRVEYWVAGNLEESIFKFNSLTPTLVFADALVHQFATSAVVIEKSTDRAVYFTSA